MNVALLNKVNQRLTNTEQNGSAKKYDALNQRVSSTTKSIILPSEKTNMD